jgi:hypothetical protein
MHFSRLTEEEAREIKAAAADPSYRQMNSMEAELGRQLAPRTPEENLQQLIVWLRFLEHLGVTFDPSRELPRTSISLL